MKSGALIAEAVLPSGKLAEVPRRLRNDLVEQLEDDAACRLVFDRYIELDDRQMSAWLGEVTHT
jgi:hypothetical protein